MQHPFERYPALGFFVKVITAPIWGPIALWHKIKEADHESEDNDSVDQSMDGN